MKKIMSLMILFAFFGSCDMQQTKDETSLEQLTDTTKTNNTADRNQVTVQLKWQTDSVLDVPESVLFDPERNRIYVSNISGKPSEKDNVGFISILDLDGTVTTLKWVEGLSAPKGMAIFGNKLYVSDINELVEIDIEKGQILHKYPAEKAQFLNDVTVDEKGLVYVSDMKGKSIYQLKNNSLNIWVQDQNFENPNGLWFENGALLVGTKKGVVKVDVDTKSSEMLITKTGSIDGLVPFSEKGYYIISDWSGAVHIIHPQKEKLLVFDTSADKINAADIDYVLEQYLLLVPTFFNNRVMAYTVALKY